MKKNNKQKKQENLFDALEKIFHEPNRLAIMSVMCTTNNGISFPELKNECNLTDGNLNRHLKVLQNTGAIKIKKAFIDLKPRTTIYITEPGIEKFKEYLKALTEVLNKAKNAIPEDKKKKIRVSSKSILADV